MDEHVMGTYARAEDVFVGGRGAVVRTEDGREFLDFLGGIAVSALGHAHSGLTAALRDQVGRCWGWKSSSRSGCAYSYGPR